MLFYFASVIIASSPFLCRSLAPFPVSGLLLDRRLVTPLRGYLTFSNKRCLYNDVLYGGYSSRWPCFNAASICIRLYLKAKIYSFVWGKKFSSTSSSHVHHTSPVLVTDILTWIPPPLPNNYLISGRKSSQGFA